MKRKLLHFFAYMYIEKTLRNKIAITELIFNVSKSVFQIVSKEMSGKREENQRNFLLPRNTGFSKVRKRNERK